jgi:cytochrome c553
LQYPGAFLLAATLLTVAACQRPLHHPAVEPLAIAPPSLSVSATLAAACSGCHGPAGSAIPDFGYLGSVALSDRLTSYKYDTIGTTVMHRLARGYSDEQIVMISAYLAMKPTDD